MFQKHYNQRIYFFFFSHLSYSTFCSGIRIALVVGKMDYEWIPVIALLAGQELKATTAIRRTR